MTVFKAALAELKAAARRSWIPPRSMDCARPQNAGPCRGFKYDLEHYLAEAGAPIKTLDE